MNPHTSGDPSLDYLKQLKTSTEDVIQHYLSTAETLPDAARIKECASRLRTYADEAYGMIVDTWYCKHPQCRVCQWRKARRNRSKFHLLLDQHPELLEGKWIYLTLTMRNCHVSNLRITMNQLNDAFRRMANRDFWTHNVLGGVRFIEVNDGGLDPETAHPHYHCLLLVRPSMFGGTNYISEKQWAYEWQQALQVPYTPKVKAQRFLSQADGLKEDILRAVSYSMKPRTHTSSRTWFLIMSKETKWMRKVESFGLLRTLLSDLSPVNDGDAIEHHEEVRQSQVPVYRSWDYRRGDYRGD